MKTPVRPTPALQDKIVTIWMVGHDMWWQLCVFVHDDEDDDELGDDDNEQGDDDDELGDDDDDNFPLPSTCVSCNPCMSGFKPGLLFRTPRFDIWSTLADKVGNGDKNGNEECEAGHPDLIYDQLLLLLRGSNFGWRIKEMCSDHCHCKTR